MENATMYYKDLKDGSYRIYVYNKEKGLIRDYIEDNQVFDQRKLSESYRLTNYLSLAEKGDPLSFFFNNQVCQIDKPYPESFSLFFKVESGEIVGELYCRCNYAIEYNKELIVESKDFLSAKYYFEEEGIRTKIISYDLFKSETNSDILPVKIINNHKKLTKLFGSEVADALVGRSFLLKDLKRLISDVENNDTIHKYLALSSFPKNLYEVHWKYDEIVNFIEHLDSKGYYEKLKDLDHLNTNTVILSLFLDYLNDLDFTEIIKSSVIDSFDSKRTYIDSIINQTYYELENFIKSLAKVTKSTGQKTLDAYIEFVKYLNKELGMKSSNVLFFLNNLEPKHKKLLDNKDYYNIYLDISNENIDIYMENFRKLPSSINPRRYKD